MKISVITKSSLTGKLFNEKALNRLRAIGEVSLHQSDDLSAEAVKPAFEGSDIVITSWGNGYFTPDLLDAAPNLKFIMHAAGSVKPVVTDEVWERGIRVAASTKPLGIGVAESAVGFAISASKNFYNVNADIHNGGYKERRADCRELYGLNVGVIGSGFVGKHFIKLIQNFSVNVLVYDPYITAEQAVKLGAKKVELEELFCEADILSVHAPSIEATNHMVNAETLSMMKKDAILINTARGSIVDEAALYRHMAAGNLKYACLDVYDPEPILPDNPLRTLSNVIMTPHLAGLANNGQQRIGDHSAEEIERFVSGVPLECEVTREMLATIA